MATATELIRLQDVLKSEAPNFFCREKLTVLDGQTLVIGETCKLDADGKVVTATGDAADEVQTITTVGTSTGGDVSFGFGELGDAHGNIELWTGPAAWNATEATMVASIQTVLDALFGTGDVVKMTIADTDICVFVVTFSGTGATDLSHRLMAIDIGNLTGATGATIVQTTEGHAAGSDTTLVALEAASPSGDDGAAVFLVRGPAIIDADRLTVTSGGTAAAVTALRRLGILPLYEADQLTAGEEG